MFLYWSAYDGNGTHATPFVPRARAAGANGSAIQFAGKARCLVGSTVQIASPPAGVTFLLNTDTDRNTALPTNVRTFINNELAVTVPTGMTWKELFVHLFTVAGTGRWGTLVGELRLNFGPAGSFDLR